MSEHELDRVIDDVLDGSATPADTAWLKECLERDPGARARYLQHERLFHALDPGELIAPPEGLPSQVLSAIRSGPRPIAPAPGWFSTLRASLAHRPAVGLGFAFGSGAAIAILIVTALTQHGGAPPGPFPVMGTIGSSSPGWTIEDRARVTTGPASSTVELMRHGGSILAGIRMESREPSGMTLEFSPSEVTVAGFGWERGPGRHIDAGAGRIDFEAGGSSLMWVRFEVPEGGNPAIRLTLRSAGVTATGEIRSRFRARASP